MFATYFFIFPKRISFSCFNFLKFKRVELMQVHFIQLMCNIILKLLLTIGVHIHNHIHNNICNRIEFHMVMVSHKEMGETKRQLAVSTTNKHLASASHL